METMFSSEQVLIDGKAIDTIVILSDELVKVAWHRVVGAENVFIDMTLIPKFAKEIANEKLKDDLLMVRDIVTQF